MRCPSDDGIRPEQVERGLLLRIRWVGHRAAVASLESAPRADHPGIETRQVKAAVKAGVLDLDAPVHYEGEAGFLAGSGNVLAPGAELEPQGRGADGERLVEHARQVIVAAEHVDQVGTTGIDARVR